MVIFIHHNKPLIAQRLPSTLTVPQSVPKVVPGKVASGASWTLEGELGQVQVLCGLRPALALEEGCATLGSFEGRETACESRERRRWAWLGPSPSGVEALRCAAAGWARPGPRAARRPSRPRRPGRVNWWLINGGQKLRVSSLRVQLTVFKGWKHSLVFKIRI